MVTSCLRREHLYPPVAHVRHVDEAFIVDGDAAGEVLASRAAAQVEFTIADSLAAPLVWFALSTMARVSTSTSRWGRRRIQ